MTSVRLERVGSAGEPVVIIDGFAPWPERLRTIAETATYEPGLHHYPGIRAPLPQDYLRDLPTLAVSQLSEAFGHVNEVNVIDASYSIVTTPAEQLSPMQRLPHCDSHSRERIAMVHYLSLSDDDGTAFFRHRSTGFETVDQQRAPIYFGQLEAEIRHRGAPPPTYIADTNPLFERIFVVPAIFNRAIMYRSWMLHSGAIAQTAALSSNPATGRLTITAFFSIA